mgnify:CR=1 FL=1
MNPLDRSTAWLEIFILMLGAFLIGYFFARWYYINKPRKDLDSHEEDETRYKTRRIEQANTTFFNEIKAVKTRNRKGEMVQSETTMETKTTPETPTLNFEAIGTATAANKDDLKKIQGIGPFIENKLNTIGIFSFEQLSKMSKTDIDTVTELIQFFPGRIERDDWVGQAKKLMKKS